MSVAENPFEGPERPLYAMFAVRDSCLPKNSKAVLHALLLRVRPAGADGWMCYPSLDTIAADCGLSRSAVCVVVDAAEKAGWLWREQGGGRSSTTYYLDLGAIQDIPKRPERKRR